MPIKTYLDIDLSHPNYHPSTKDETDNQSLLYFILPTSHDTYPHWGIKLKATGYQSPKFYTNIFYADLFKKLLIFLNKTNFATHTKTVTERLRKTGGDFMTRNNKSQSSQSNSQKSKTSSASKSQTKSCGNCCGCGSKNN